MGEFAHKVAALKEQTGNQLLSVVESFRKRNLEMKKDRFVKLFIPSIKYYLKRYPLLFNS